MNEISENDIKCPCNRGSQVLKHTIWFKISQDPKLTKKEGKSFEKLWRLWKKTAERKILIIFSTYFFFLERLFMAIFFTLRDFVRRLLTASRRVKYFFFHISFRSRCLRRVLHNELKSYELIHYLLLTASRSEKFSFFIFCFVRDVLAECSTMGSSHISRHSTY